MSISIFPEKIKVPDWAKKVNIDVGTSYNAPYSEYWLNKDKELIVFAFEPNIYNYKGLINNNILKNNHKYLLDKKRVNKSFFIFNCALSDKNLNSTPFYCTKEDPGTSSLYKPKNMSILKQTKVPCIKLSEFFNRFPWEQIPYINLLKIDAQGEDFNIVKGCENYLSEKVVCLIVETSTHDQYFNTNNNSIDFKKYIENQNFICEAWKGDGVFYNKKFKDLAKNIDHRPH
jgi:FkbM family methyltransferase